YLSGNPGENEEKRNELFIDFSSACLASSVIEVHDNQSDYTFQGVAQIRLLEQSRDCSFIITVFAPLNPIHTRRIAGGLAPSRGESSSVFNVANESDLDNELSSTRVPTKE
ncbi:unnamed protein product, partial [Owenia fusiformis]